MVILNQSLQIIDNSMEESIVIRNRGGGCIVKHSSLFSADGKYVYILCGWCVSAYSVQTGECAHQFVTETKEDLAHFAIYEQYLLSITSSGNLTIWKTNSNVPENLLKLELEDNTAVVEIYAVASQKKGVDFDLVVVVRDQDNKDLQLLLYLTSKGKLSNLYARAEDKPHSVSVCDQFVAAFKHDRLTVIPFAKNTNNTSMLAGGGRWWTVVGCSSESKGLAAGDNTGRILYWPQPLQSNARAVFHWHTLPVTALAFSPSGSYLYSGGGEGVMVRWNVEVSNVRNFLPRLPAPIVHLTVSPDNQYVAIATQDNGIQLADSQNRVSCVIQKLTWGVSPVVGAALFPAGLVWDPRSKSIVLNGRPGHLQFFNTDDNKLLYNLDITGQNYLAQERLKEVINAEVTHVAISHDGKWMVTVETRDDHDSFLETLIKFWQYKFNARQFSLNTCVQLPHQGRVNDMRFQPPTGPNHYLLVTTGTDSKFRVWLPSLSESIHSEGLRWVCDSVGYYRGMPPKCAAFSADGSVLGVTFGSSLTLWDAEISKLNTSLTRDSSVLKAVEFGLGECCHLVVTASDSQLDVWSILTLSVVWAVPVRASLLCADPFSTNMAVFTADNSVFVFSPSNPKPFYEKRDLCKSGNNVLAAIFVPRPQILLDISASWCANSQLHFIDSNQELQYLEVESEQDPQQSLRGSVNSTSPATPFSVLTAKQSTSSVEKAQGTTHLQFGTSGDAAVRKLLSSPAHTMPHIHLFCVSFLKSLAITRKTEKEKRQKDKSEGVTKMETGEDNDSDIVSKNNVAKVSTKRKKKKRTKKKSVTEENELDKSPKKEIKEIPSKKKQRRKPNKEKKSPKKKENSFSIDDLDSDWLSVLENR